MKKLFFILTSLILISTASYAAEIPKLQGYVNDYAGMISSAPKTRIEEQLKALEQSDSTQIFVLTVPSLESDTIEEFAIKVFDVWKAGQKGKDNGALLIVAQKERKIRIEVGRGLEGKLTDLAAGRIIDNIMKPKFKDGDYDGGFTAGVSSLIQSTKGEFKANGMAAQGKHKWMILLASLGLCVVITFILGLSHPFYGTVTGTLGAPVSVIGIGVSDPTVIGFAAVFGGFAAILVSAVAWSLFGKGKGLSVGGGAIHSRSDFNRSDSSNDSSSSDSFSGGGGDSGGGGASGDY